MKSLLFSLLVGFCGLVQAQDGEELDPRLVDRLTIFYENAKSFRNYDVTVEFSAVYAPVDSESKIPPYLKETEERIVMDWEKERYFWISRKAREATAVEETLTSVRFENSVELKRDKASFGRPVVGNVAFGASLERMSVPMIERASLLGFPGSYIAPIEQLQLRLSQKKSRESKTQFRFLPDGTGVRTVESPSGGHVSTVHFDRKTLMPVSMTSTSDKRPTLITKTKYEEIEGVFRPIEMVVQKFEICEDYGQDIQDIKFASGTGKATFRWHAFNEAEIKLPDDSSLLNAERNEWIKMIRGD